jgi:hypothetical protein
MSNAKKGTFLTKDIKVYGTGYNNNNATLRNREDQQQQIHFPIQKEGIHNTKYKQALNNI